MKGMIFLQIEVKNVSKYYNVGKSVVKALDSVDFTVNDGEFVAIIGSSGSGKSTLMSRIFPDLKLKTGEISRKTQRGKHTTRHAELYPSKQRRASALLQTPRDFQCLITPDSISLMRPSFPTPSENSKSIWAAANTPSAPTPRRKAVRCLTR